MRKSTTQTAVCKKPENEHAFKGDRKKFIPIALRTVSRDFEDAELRFLCLTGLALADTQGLLATEPNIIQEVDAASVTGKRAVLRETLPALTDVNLDTWACYFFRIVAAHDLGEHGQAAVNLAFSGVNLSGQRKAYYGPDAKMYREVHGLIDALPRDRVEAMRKDLHRMALGLKAGESTTSAAEPVAAVA